jgi:hypothetical protein
MIKFFRKIRQSLLAEGKFTDYLKYAIGEIVLVVVGILIALQLNNWNEGRKMDAQVRDQLTLLVKELEGDIRFYQRITGGDPKRIEFLRALSEGRYDSIYLQKTMFSISFNYDTRSFGTSYHVLKENGSLNVLKDQKLRERLINYFEVSTVAYNDHSSWHRNFVYQNVESYVMQHLPLNPDLETDAADVIEEMKGANLRNIVNVQARNHRGMAELTTSYIQEAEALKELVLHVLNEPNGKLTGP